MVLLWRGCWTLLYVWEACVLRSGACCLLKFTTLHLIAFYLYFSLVQVNEYGISRNIVALAYNWAPMRIEEVKSGKIRSEISLE